MEGQYWEWECLACGNKFRTHDASETIPCPTCGSKCVTRLVAVSDKGKGHEFQELRCKDNAYPSKKKLRRHIQAGLQQGGDGRLVDKWRLIDVDKDDYEEKVTDFNTGELLRKTKEPLSQHRGRGSARKK
jgi:DNA-directed RNA polymerase subunit RPC12/RpoP